MCSAARFEEVGGYDESLTGAEDWDLADRVEQAGYRLGRVESFADHDEGRLRPRDTSRKKRYYGLHSAEYLAEARKSGVRQFLRTALIARPVMLLRQPHRAVGLLVLKTVEASQGNRIILSPTLAFLL